ncbi:putative protein OS=Streptomyces aurantiogriseus OX=66870 GN=GCM10010251_83090 PE=4 SV=1 [Streptomyces aurantiogriseus]|uniref:Uncharacterized protein n=1 Tax=Streptomyces aurantiogriseus TaxID=66870 RepID=A0A918FM06_9ACTN|nr:hypothetical protein GCM10010251_83090 [Streptomyces aurantiogriseus]
MIQVPETFVRGTIEREGEPGADWLGRLPRLVDDLLADWDCRPEGEVLHGGVGIVVPVIHREVEEAWRHTARATANAGTP